jgi:transposase-like protein
MNSKVELIRELIPLGLMYVSELLQKEVDQLAGKRYSRAKPNPDVVRHGSNPGSVKLAGQRHPIEVPRVRNRQTQEEIPLESWQSLRGAGETDESLMKKVLYGISTRNYEAAAEAVPGAIGLSYSTVSREFIKASAKHLKEFQERDLSSHDVVALFLDGKTFADDAMVIALGVTLEGEKVLLGFVQTGTENAKVLTPFLNQLLDRGLSIDEGVLVIIDGGKGLRAAVKKAFKDKAVVQRCQWHKRENVVHHLPKKEQEAMRKRMQQAYQKATYKEAKTALRAIHEDLKQTNLNAAASLEEGMEETLTLHRLGVFTLLGISFKTTNCLESINNMVEDRCRKVKCWKNSKQKHRWLAASLLDIEPRLRKIKGYKFLSLLREKLRQELGIESRSDAA